MRVYELKAFNLQGLDMRQGEMNPPTKFVRLFKSPSAAKRAAEKDYAKDATASDGSKGFAWKRNGKGEEWSSGDLIWVCYDIRAIDVEE